MINNKKYIGQTQNLRKRWAQHKYNSQFSNFLLYKAMRKYGIKNFRFTPLEIHETQEEADEAEKFWIQLLETRVRTYGYNLKEGGSHGIFSEESKLKMSISSTGKRHSIGARQKMSEAHSGVKNYNFGKKRKEETKDKISKTLIDNKIVYGENNPRAKLNWDTVTNIRSEYKKGNITQEELAAKYGVTRTMIGYIVRNKMWINE